MNARIVIVPAVNGEYFLRFVASNGKKLGISETYDSLSNARRAASDWYDAMRQITTQGLTASVQEASD